jgi:hypothetical protein
LGKLALWPAADRETASDNDENDDAESASAPSARASAATADTYADSLSQSQSDEGGDQDRSDEVDDLMSQIKMSKSLYATYDLQVLIYQPGGLDDPSKVVKVVASDGKSGDQREFAYTNCKVIGNGSFGVVFQAKLVQGAAPGTDDQIAIKKVLQDKRFKVRPANPRAPLAQR